MKKLGQICSEVVALIWGFLPWKTNQLLGKFLAFLWIDVFAIRRQVIDQNLEIAFPQMPAHQKTEIARASMVSLCRSFFDVMKIPSLTTEWIQKNVIFGGLDHFLKLKAQHGKVLFLTLHLGSGDLGAAIFGQVVMPSSLITKKFKSDFLDSFWYSMRSKSKTEFIDAHSSKNAFEILGALKRQRGIFFVLDQFMGKPYGVETKFFGVKTGTAYGLALFAKKTKLPVVPIYSFWDENGQFHINIEPPIDLSREFSDTGEDQNAAITNRFNQELEKIISNHPNHWMWVHRRWKTFE